MLNQIKCRVKNYSESKNNLTKAKKKWSKKSKLFYASNKCYQKKGMKWKTAQCRSVCWKKSIRGEENCQLFLLKHGKQSPSKRTARERVKRTEKWQKYEAFIGFYLEYIQHYSLCVYAFHFSSQTIKFSPTHYTYAFGEKNKNAINC